LPAGSFVKGTLLSGVFAPVDKTNPLPVVFSIDEAFYGPTKSRIPVKGMLGIGKTTADINSSRAIIQVVRLAYVFPDGGVWEKDIDGWVCGSDGILGIEGKVVRHEGKELAGAFSSGFMSGVGQGLAQAQTQTSSTTSGTFESSVTGSATKYSLYSGLSSAANTLSQHYAQMLQEIVTEIEVEKGTPIQIVIQQGVEIENHNSDNNINPSAFE